MEKTTSTEPKVSVVKMYAAREQIYPREIKGRYATLRWVFVWLTQLFFYGVPWLSWNGRQALLFDLAERKFYVFGLVLWPQDFIYLAGLLIISAYLLFLATATAGRVWCGFTCPQTVYTEMFMWIERKVEGTRSARMRLDKQPASFSKYSKKTIKHLLWGMLALWTGFTFVGYFTPIIDLGHSVMGLSLGGWEWFWILFYAFATYGNAGWMREQVCKHMCPYARFQSAMFDPDTLIISYDEKRGEPRAPLGKDETAETRAKGDCIDCTLCVQVCPTGIDIRNGLQYDCIGCAACIDACNTVMDKVGFERGLIRYTTENSLKQDTSYKQIVKRMLRPRVLVYSVVLLMIVSVFVGTLIVRTPIKLDVVRDRGVMGREVEDGLIENVYLLQVSNTDEKPHRYRISVSGLVTIKFAGEPEFTLESTGSRSIPVRVRVDPTYAEKGSNRILFQVQSLENPDTQVEQKAVFLIPR